MTCRVRLCRFINAAAVVAAEVNGVRRNCATRNIRSDLMRQTIITVILN